MSQRYPCPNPICTHEFAPSDLAGAASLTCPRCGMVIQLQPSAPPPPVPSTATIPMAALPPGGVPMARPVGPVPMAAPVGAVPMARPVPPGTAPTIPMAAVVAPMAAPTAQPYQTAPLPRQASLPANEIAAPIVRKQKLPKSHDFLTYTLVLGGFLLLVIAGIVFMVVRDRGDFGKLFQGGSGYKNSDLNYHFDPKVTGWEENTGLKNTTGVSQLALSRSNPAGYFALDVVDFKEHTPSARELDDAARRKLKEIFPKNLETEPFQQADSVAGQPSHRLIFQGDTPEQTFSGEVVFFGNQGLGYWFYAWAPTADAKGLAGEFAQLRKSFNLLGERADWRKLQQQRKVFEGDNVKGYQVSDSTGRWELYNDPKAHDSEADIVLQAKPPKSQSPTLGADLIVISLKPGKDPIDAARAHILANHERAYPGTKISDIEGEGAKDRVGEVKGHLLRWRINNGGGRERFAIVGVVPRADDILVLYGDCQWDRRFNWELQMQQLIESIQLK